MKFVISNKLTVIGISYDFSNVTQERLTMPNPKWYENEKIPFWNNIIKRIVDNE